jgi:hypothetical protein
VTGIHVEANFKEGNFVKNIFIAIGGSGTKVAEVLVRLLTIGFPTTKQTVEGNKQILTSAGDTLEIWRIDPDSSSNASDALNQSLEDYIQMHEALGGSRRGANDDPQQIATSKWGMDVVTKIRQLNPLELPGESDNQTNVVSTLKGILDSGDKGRLKSEPFLNLLYKPEELNIQIDRGFYQKPFIGAPIMAIFSRYLELGRTREAKNCNLTNLANNPARFFLCGSLHGGTGACGVPVMAKFLGELKKQNANWKLGGCMLAPYAQPPLPPSLPQLRSDLETEPQIKSIITQYRGEEPFRNAPNPDEMIRQILQGFYAKPQEVVHRAIHGLEYYKNHLVDHFDALYLVGKSQLDQLDNWSNGGSSQINPINSAEVVGAISALNFFSGTHDNSSNKANSYIIGTAPNSFNPQKMRLRDLPRYSVGGTSIDVEQVFLAAATARYLIRHSLPWDRKTFTGKEFLYIARNYKNFGLEFNEDIEGYGKASAILSRSINALIHPDPRVTKGWSGEDYVQVKSLLLDNPDDVNSVMAKLQKKNIVNNAPREPIYLGNSKVEVRDEEFQKWGPDQPEFSRGEYLRYIWTSLTEKAN